MAVKKIDLAWIVVADLAKSKKYFNEVVGLKINQDSENHGWVEFVGKEGGGLLGLTQANPLESMPAGHNAVIAFTVEDIAKTKSDMAKKDVIFIGDMIEVPGVVKLQLFSDLDGNRFQLAQEL